MNLRRVLCPLGRVSLDITAATGKATPAARVAYDIIMALPMGTEDRPIYTRYPVLNPGPISNYRSRQGLQDVSSGAPSSRSKVEGHRLNDLDAWQHVETRTHPNGPLWFEAQDG